MSPRKYPVRWSMVFFTALVVGLLFFWETSHLKIETDILESMPHDDPVLASARQVIGHLPVQDKIFIDLEQASDDRENLVRAADVVAAKLKQSGLFAKVGISDEAARFPELAAYVASHLPMLFSASELEQKIAPLLAPEKIRETMAQNRQSLGGLEGIGRADMMTRDPLGFSGVILGQMSALLPANKAQFYQGQLLSADGRHALIIARIAGSGTDTARAAQIERLLEDCRRDLAKGTDFKASYRLTSVGAYRAALDNETVAKRDTRLAILLTMLGIALLLILAFPRPFIGLLALLPSAVGAIAALFVCSFVFDSMSVLAVGFGGAILAFTVDLGLTYLLFLDQPRTTYGKQIAREVWSAEWAAVLTTVGAFLLLLISDFKILSQIGVFAALGITFAFLFVHIVFPKIFPAMPPARRAPNVFLQTAVDALAAPARWKFVSAVIFAAVMLVFARPVFNVDMRAMNSVSPETIAAENKLQETWGNLSGQCYVLLEAASLGELQEKNEQLAALLADEVRQEKLAPVFLPSVLFPSPLSAENNIAAWQRFWNKDRIAALERELDAAAVENGFAPEAFEPFRKMIGQAFPEVSGIPGQYFEMLGIARTSDGYAQLSLLTTGKNYDAGDLWNRLSRSGLADFFDVDLFNQKLGEFLKKIFFEIAFIVSAGLILIIFVFFMDWRLSLAVLSPVVFALVATLGTLKMIGHPLDIPGIMLWIVIMGMGIDYSIYYTCTYQRHPEDRAPAMRTIRLSMGLAACTTLIGFGVLTLARHPLLASIGLVSLFGIGYSLAGAYLILPFLLNKIFSPEPFPSGAFTVGSREHRRRTVLRYRHLPGYPRIFARFKMMMDPMFQELDQYVQNPRRMMDIGCGFGVPAAWLMELYPQAKVFGLEPDEERVLIASRAWGDRGRAQTGGAPDLPEVEGSVDHVLMLDMLHLITDEELALVLGRIFDKLENGGTLLIRATVPSERKIPWKRWIEAIRLKWTGTPERFRREEEIAGFMNAAGFSVRVHASLSAGVEEKWFRGEKVI